MSLVCMRTLCSPLDIEFMMCIYDLNVDMLWDGVIWATAKCKEEWSACSSRSQHKSIATFFQIASIDVFTTPASTTS